MDNKNVTCDYEIICVISSFTKCIRCILNKMQHDLRKITLFYSFHPRIPFHLFPHNKVLLHRRKKKQTCESLINVPDVSPRLRCVQEINSAVRYFLRGWKGEEKSHGAKISGRSILSFTGRLAPKKGAKLLHTLNKFADGGKR